MRLVSLARPALVATIFCVPLMTDAATLKLGGFRNAATDANCQGFFPGSIDDVRIYNRALSAAEVLQLYNLSK